MHYEPSDGMTSARPEKESRLIYVRAEEGAIGVNGELYLYEQDNEKKRDDRIKENRSKGRRHTRLFE